MGSASDLQDLAADVLDVAEQILAVTGGPPLVRSLVAHGAPALDCADQLSVHVANVGEALTQATDPLAAGLRHARPGRINLTGLIVTLTRCYPAVDGEGNLPGADDETAASATLNADGWALWNGLYRARDVLFAACDLVFFDGIVPLPPQGACAGYIMQIRFELPGYPWPGGS